MSFSVTSQCDWTERLHSLVPACVVVCTRTELGAVTLRLEIRAVLTNTVVVQIIV